MATPVGQGYRSPLNLDLGQLPKTQDPVLFQEMIPVYNAIHTLNAYLDRLRLSLEGGDPDKPPSEEMRFVRGFWADAGEDISQGKIITMIGGKVRLGCGKRRRVIGTGAVVDCFPTGIAMTEALEGEKVRFGIGPAILNVPGYKAGDQVYATPPGGSFAGDFLPDPPGAVEGAVKIGLCVIDDYVMIVPDYLNL